MMLLPNYLYYPLVFVFIASPVLSYSSSSCPLLGPAYLAPRNFPSGSPVDTAGQNLTKIIEESFTTQNSSLGPITLNSTAFTINVFSSHTDTPLYQYEHTSSELTSPGNNGTKNPTQHSIYRVASVSKLLTVLTLLTRDGVAHWDSPVSEFVPELRAAAGNASLSAETDPVLNLAWDIITLRDLASQLGGVPHDYAFEDFIGSMGEEAVLAGFPPVPDQDVPPCGLGEGSNNPEPACGREAFLNGLIRENPTFAPGSTPLYSNAAFEVLQFALQNITGESFATSFHEGIVKPLQLNETFLTQPSNSSQGVIPVTDTASLWNYNFGDGDSFGGIYSSAHDLATIGRAILQSMQSSSPLNLTSALTRRWLKPASHTNSLTVSVGAPWEIFRYEMPNFNHVVDVYTKSGNVGAYADILAIIPEWDIGFAILAADSIVPPLNSIWTLSSLLNDEFFPALDAMAKQEADRMFAGTYKAKAQAGLNSSMVLSTDPSNPGVRIKEWISNGTDFIGILDKPLGIDSFAVGLYPTDLVMDANCTATKCKKIAYRAIVESPALESYKGSITPSCQNWLMVDEGQYASISLDQFVVSIAINNDQIYGQVLSVEPRALRVKLDRQG